MEKTPETKKTKQTFNGNCPCGSVLGCKGALKKHLKGRKHLIFLGERSPSVLSSKVATLNEDEKEKRREYYRIKGAEFRQRRRESENGSIEV